MNIPDHAGAIASVSVPSDSPSDPRQELAYERTHLANERTFAAWIRTGLSIAAGGIAVARLVPEPSRDSLLGLTLGAAFVGLGIGLMAYGAHEFARVRRQIAHEGAVLKAPSSIRAAYTLMVVIAILLTLVLYFLWSHQGRATTLATPLSSSIRATALVQQ